MLNNGYIYFTYVGYVTKPAPGYPTGCTGEPCNDKMQTPTHVEPSGIGLQHAPSIGKYLIVGV